MEELQLYLKVQETLMDYIDHPLVLPHLDNTMIIHLETLVSLIINVSEELREEKNVKLEVVQLFQV